MPYPSADQSNGLTAQHWDIYRTFLEMASELYLRIERCLKAETGLTPSDMEVLLPLLEAPDQRLRPSELARKAGWSSSRVAHELRRLERRGWIVRGSFGTDQRGVTVHMTAAGWKKTTEALPIQERAIKRAFVDALSEEELLEFGRLSQRIIEQIKTLD